jgi:RHO1 GDP-GTP exchange protein 1/2
MELKVFLTGRHPLGLLQRYKDVLEAIAKETDGNPDVDYLTEAVKAFRDLQAACVLEAFQHAMCRGPTAELEWHDLISEDVRATINKSEQKRQR